jgi:flagellar basal-body rod protein FlgG
MRTASTAAQAQERVFDAAAHNLANAETPGFKNRRVALVEQTPGTAIFTLPTQAGGITMSTEGTGQGVNTGALLVDLAPGSIRTTGRALDVAIVGPGFLTLTLPDGRTAYSRAGVLHTNLQGRLATPDGATIAGISIPDGVGHVAIAPDGTVSGQLGTGAPITVGRIQLAQFPNPEGLEPLGQNLVLAGASSGPALTSDPGTNGVGLLAPGSLEASNVDVTEELTRIIQAQRAYQINLRALRTIDEMLQSANSFVR